MEGDPALPDWPLLVLTARRKLQLGNYSLITLTHVTGYRHRMDNGGRMPGADMLVPSAPGTRGAMLMQTDSGLLLDYCYPKATAEANYAAIPRPAHIPGVQRYEVFAPQDGCRNDTELLTRRCYPSRIDHIDLAMPAMEPDVSGKPAYAFYDAWQLNTRGFCINLLSDQCIVEFGALGCFLKESRLSGSQPTLLPWLLEHDFLSRLAAGPAGAAATSSGDISGGGGAGNGNASAQAAAAAGAQAAAAGGSDNDNQGENIGIAVGVAVGGAALTAVIVAAAVFVVRRRRAQAAATAAACWTNSSKRGAGPAEAEGGHLTIMLSPKSAAGHDAPTPPGVSAALSEFPLVGTSSSVTGSHAPCTPALARSPRAAQCSPYDVVTLRTPFHTSFCANASLVGSSVCGPVRSTGTMALSATEGGDQTRSQSQAQLGDGFNSRVVLSALRAAAYESGASTGPVRSGPQQQAAGALASGGQASGAPAADAPARSDTSGRVNRGSGSGGSDGRGAGGSGSGGAAGSKGGSAEAPDVVELLPTIQGKGAFGRVQEGRYRGQVVAVKLILSAEDVAAGDACALTAALAQELEVLARCQHPNIVRLLAACVEPPRPFCVLERMETSLDKVLYGKAPGPDGGAEGGSALLPLPMILHIAREISRGLDFLHPTITHRDLKPANCLLNDPWGPSPVVKISDFGIARLRETMLITRDPEVGTAAYLAPECFDVAGTGCLTHRADMWSFGVLLWEMLAGVRPWQGMAPVSIAIQVTIKERRLPMPLLAEGPGADPSRWPRRLVRLIASCWERDAQRRPAAAEVANELALLLESPQELQQ